MPGAEPGSGRTDAVAGRILDLVQKKLKVLGLDAVHVRVQAINGHAYSITMRGEGGKRVFTEDRRTSLRQFFTESFADTVKPILERYLEWDPLRVTVTTCSRHKCVHSCEWLVTHKEQARHEARMSPLEARLA